MVAQIQVTTTTEIIASYTSDFDGVTYDTIKMVFPDGTVELRTGWTELNDDGETIHFLRTEKGSVLNGNWATTKTNKWLVAYKSLKPAKQPRAVAIPQIINSFNGKLASAGRIKSNPDLDITEDQYDKIMSDYRVSLGW
jgi:hypothetical protein